MAKALSVIAVCLSAASLALSFYSENRFRWLTQGLNLKRHGNRSDAIAEGIRIANEEIRDKLEEWISTHGSNPSPQAGAVPQE